MTTIEIQPIAEAPVHPGIEDMTPALVAPGEGSGWIIACWDGEHWFDRFSGMILQLTVYAALPPVPCAESPRPPDHPAAGHRRRMAVWGR
jgi:hypothetical protein